jgi:asparagine synthase (glutamine-hydrolysing)
VDRATMAYSIEGREPLTDHRLIEYCARLPLEFKLKEGVKKRILKDIVHQYIPQEMMDRPKAGFSVPIYDWLKGDLSYILDLHLNKDAIDETGIFNTEFVLKIVEDFKNSKLPDETIIWKLLMFQMWFAKWMKN